MKTNSSLHLIFWLAFFALAYFPQISLAQDLWKNPAWQKLNYYSNKQVSRITDPSFFIHVKGRSEPQSELASFIEFLQKPELAYSRWQVPVQCVFPARAKWVYANATELQKLPPLDFQKCSGYRLFLQDAGAQKISYVYVGAFITNPGSVMGHSALLIKKKDQFSYTDMAVGYAASVPPDINPFSYALRGVFGGFDGLVKAEPFFNKIKEYSKIENRSIWEYELNLTVAEVGFIVDHLFEIRNRPLMNYYFFDGNCASLLVELVDQVRPDLRLPEQMGLIVIPSKVPELFFDNKLVAKTAYVPPYNEVIRHHFSYLSENDQDRFLNTDIDFSAKPEAVDSHLLLKMYMLRMDHQAMGTDGKLSPEEQTRFNALVMRSFQLKPQAIPVLKTPEDPKDSHPISYLSFQSGEERGIKNKAFLELSLRPFAHEILESDTGQVRYSEVNVFKTTLRQGQDKRVRLENFILGNLYSFPKFHPIYSPSSYKLEIGLRQSRSSNCDDCLGGYGNFAYGYGRDFFEQNLMVALMGRLDQQYNSSDRSYYQAGLGPEIQVVWQPFKNWKWTADVYLLKLSGGKDSRVANLESMLRLNSSWSLTGQLSYWDFHDYLSDQKQSRTDYKFGLNFYL